MEHLHIVCTTRAYIVKHVVYIVYLEYISYSCTKKADIKRSLHADKSTFAYWCGIFFPQKYFQIYIYTYTDTFRNQVDHHYVCVCVRTLFEQHTSYTYFVHLAGDDDIMWGCGGGESIGNIDEGNYLMFLCVCKKKFLSRFFLLRTDFFYF